MSQKLTYEEWREKYAKVSIDADVVESLQKLHNVDAHKEIEAAMQKEYEVYANGGFDNV